MHKFFRDKNKTVFILLCLINTVTYCFSQQFSQINDKIIIASGIIDLHGATKCLPKNYTLIVKNGIIKNGTLIGNQTKLQCSGKIFDNVHTINVKKRNTFICNEYCEGGYRKEGLYPYKCNPSRETGD